MTDTDSESNPGGVKVPEATDVLVNFAQTTEEYAGGPETLQGVFEASARKTPEAVAVIFDGEEYSYAEINRRANRLAHHLRAEFGIQPDETVGILVDRSVRMVVGILAILKSGGAYVPIDPKYPESVIRYMLDDAGVSAIVLDSDHLRVVDGLSAPLFYLDLEMDDLATPDSDPELVNRPSDLAYIIYTSGSTGQRKGVAIEHRLILNTLHWRRESYEFDENEVAIQIPSYAFDSSVLDLFSMFMSGARLVILKDGYKTDVDYIRRLALQYNATHMLVTPTFYKMLLEGMEGVESFTKITVAGEAATEMLVRKHFAYLPNAKLVNEYGPTENSVCSTATELKLDDEYISIGRPISNGKAYILNEDLEPVPLGAVGELCLGGRGVARGYVNKPELTEEKFIPDPFSEEDGARLYRTGDLARWRADGRLEYLGRLDNQVKVRGLRVELGEIESALNRHAKVEDSVVACITDGDGDQRLVAYVIETEPTPPAELHTHLQSLVPEHMVPSGFVAIDELPIGSNGKVDRNALPDPDGLRKRNEGTYVAPRSPTEASLVGMWQAILKCESVGVMDDFFQLGGNSLQAAQLLLRIRRELGAELTLPEMFSNQTIDRLAKKVEASPAD